MEGETFYYITVFIPFSVLQRIIQNLHVVLCLTPLSSEMAQIRKKFPCLMTHTTVDVFDEWPSEALYSVAVKELQKEERRHGELMKVD